MRSFKLTDWPMLVLGGALLVGCVPTEGTETTETPAPEEQALNSENGMSEINGLSGNGLSGNGLSGNGLSGNGLSGNGLIMDGLAGAGLLATSPLMNSASGRMTVSYLVKCALPAGRTITKRDSANNPYNFTGQIGVAPQWETGTCNTTCQELMSACMLAHVNAAGQHIQIWIDGDSPAIGWGKSTSFPYQEGSFFGNIFVSPPKAYYCNGPDFDQGVVPGRLGVSNGNVPYTNPLGPNVTCQNRCTWQSSSHDGFSQCPDNNNNIYRHIVTVWRNFDPATSYKIVDRVSGKVLDTNGSTAANAAIVQKTYTGAAGQKWNITQVSPGKYKIISVGSGKSLDINGTTVSNGTAIVQNTYTGATKQQWVIYTMGDGTGQNKLYPSIVTYQVAGPSLTNPSAEGGAITMWQDQSNDAQKWTITVAN